MSPRGILDGGGKGYESFSSLAQKKVLTSHRFLMFMYERGEGAGAMPLHSQVTTIATADGVREPLENSTRRAAVV